MALSQIGWRDVQQMSDDGKRREAIEGELYATAAPSSRHQEVVEADGIRGAPELVVEILSPSTEERDRGVKLKLYRRQGVREYWLVDPAAEAVEVWDFRGEEPRCRRLTDRLPVRLRGNVVGEVDLPEVFGAS